MAQHNSYNIQLQITRMFQEGQSFFANTKVQDWLKERNENPNDYHIGFEQKIPEVGSRRAMIVEIKLSRKDGQPVAEWLLKQLNNMNSAS